MHELGLEVHGVEKLLLPLPLDVEPLDLVLQVLDRGPGKEAIPNLGSRSVRGGFVTAKN